MGDDKIYDEPGKVTARGDVVHLEAPNGVGVSLTPHAAIETSDRLLEAGMTAQGRRIIEERQKRDHVSRSNEPELRSANPLQRKNDPT